MQHHHIIGWILLAAVVLGAYTLWTHNGGSLSQFMPSRSATSFGPMPGAGPGVGVRS